MFRGHNATRSVFKLCSQALFVLGFKKRVLGMWVTLSYLDLCPRYTVREVIDQLCSEFLTAHFSSLLGNHEEAATFTL